ncbi:MAG TPA: EamA family transporter [Gaiellales bacterium]|nr:EamA family transporter [Gaiellales bacterium]
MSADALALALAAALVHALWNVLVGSARDPRPAAAVAMLVGIAAALPIAVATWDVRAAAIPWIAASAVLELAYIALLAAAYRGAAVPVVYPVARGAAPPLVLAIAVATGATASPAQVAGVLLVAAGIGVVALGAGRAPSRQLGLALGVAVTIAGYTVVDKHGLRYGSPVPYLEAVMVWPSLAYAAWSLSRDGRPALRAAADRSSLVAGVGMFGAYALALAALQRAPAASVSAVRESSIVMAPLLAAMLGRSRLDPRMLAGAAVVAAGVAVVTLA